MFCFKPSRLDPKRLSAEKTLKVRINFDHSEWWETVKSDHPLNQRLLVILVSPCSRRQFCCECLPPERDGGMREVQRNRPQTEKHAGTDFLLFIPSLVIDSCSSHVIVYIELILICHTFANNFRLLQQLNAFFGESMCEILVFCKGNECACFPFSLLITSRTPWPQWMWTVLCDVFVKIAACCPFCYVWHQSDAVAPSLPES